MKRALLPSARQSPCSRRALALRRSVLPLRQIRPQTREALRQALAEAPQAEARSKQLESEASASGRGGRQDRRAQAAALAARIQQAEAGIAAAEARIALVDRERATLRAQLGAEQEPVVRLTAALQQFSRRPIVLSVLRPGSVKETVYTARLARQRRAGGAPAHRALARAACPRRARCAGRPPRPPACCATRPAHLNRASAAAG